MLDIDFSAPPPPRPPQLCSPSPMTAKRGPAESTTSTLVTVRLASKMSVTSIHHQIQISSTPPSNNESSSSEGSVYYPEYVLPFLDQFFLIVIASCRPEPVLTSTDVAAQHTREGAFPPLTILVAPPERQQPSPNDTVSLAPKLPPKDQLPDFHLTLLMHRHLLSHRLLTTIAIQLQLNSQCNCLPESEYLKSRFCQVRLGAT